ncbi:cytochrome C [Telluribacter humicola]|uniref:cytochrome C n=1 Tax=Telluribacter humicola TaxID=1720261 RepID=UPI001A967196|nr:cytochrome C [Telluribacter humicola]
MEDRSSVIIFIDDDQQPVGSFKSPINFELDTRKLPDGEHFLRIVSQDPSGKEGIRKIPFTVRNGPDITVEGLQENEVVDGVLPIMVSAYGKGDQKIFLIEGSETPRSIPNWIWVLHIGFGGWAIYYLLTQLFIAP